MFLKKKTCITESRFITHTFLMSGHAFEIIFQIVGPFAKRRSEVRMRVKNGGTSIARPVNEIKQW